MGFLRAHVREHILPEWWKDGLAVDPGNWLLAEMAISRTLRIPLEAVAELCAPLSLTGTEETRLRGRQDVEASHCLPVIAIARRVFEILLACWTDLSTFRLESASADSLRERLLARSPAVTLANLIEVAWDCGMPVSHLGVLPDDSQLVDSMVFCVEGRRCIALAGARRSPSSLLWHLAYEPSHVALGNVASGVSLDIAIDFASEQAERHGVNLFVHELLKGAHQPPWFREASVDGGRHRRRP